MNEPITEFNPLVSYFPNAFENLPSDIAAAQFIASIKSNQHKKLVEEIRERFQRAISRGVPYAQAKRVVDSQKKKLPSVSFAGVLPMRDKKATPQFTGLLCADLDLLGDRLPEILATLHDDPHIYQLFRSPSDGIKAIYRVPICKSADEYKLAFAAVSARVQDLTGIEIDRLEDFTRLCFASYDPDAYHNPNAVELPVDFAQMPLSAVEIKKAASPIPPKSATFNGESRRHIAARILGNVEWESDVLGYCKCPGEHLHTNGNAPKDCRVTLDGSPTVFCLHKSCAPEVEKGNRELRSRIGKAERPAAPDSNYSGIVSEYLGGDAEPEAPLQPFTIRTPDEILEMVFNDDDIIVGDRIIAEAQSSVIVAAGGLGKSRISLQLAGSVVSGRKFWNFATGKPDSSWLILQTENSNRRLHDDLKRLKSWLGDDWNKFAVRVKFHTVENDTDSLVNLDSPEAVANIQAAIKLHAPDIIIIDPLNDFSIGDLNKDADMRLTLQTLSRICRKGNPKRAIVVLHHALTGKAGASKATGFDRASFGRNSKTLHAWTRAQINLAPVDPDSNERLIVACGKCSNGREFQTFAVRLNPDTMIYDVDPTVDVSQWEQDITGSKDNTPLMNPDRVRELCAVTGSTKTTLAKAIMEDCGCYRGSAYRYITRAEQAKKITFNKSRETYFRK